MLPFRPYIVRGLPLTEEYQTTRCTVWMKRMRTAAFFTTVSDMLLWMTLSVWKNQSTSEAFHCCDSQTNLQNCSYHMVFLFLNNYMIKVWLKGKQWFDRTQKCWHFLLLRNQDFKYCIIWYVARASTCKKTRFESSWTDYNHTIVLFFPLVQYIHVTIF